MIAFLGLPRLLKNAFIGIDSINLLSSVVVFQCDSNTICEMLQTRKVGLDEFGSRVSDTSRPEKVFLACANWPFAACGS